METIQAMPSTENKTSLVKIDNNKNDEIVLARIHMGHSELTHQYVFNRDSPLLCSCNSPLTISHILDTCSEYKIFRIHVFPK